MATVLVIDDEEALRSVICKRLALEGHETLSYADAAPALTHTDLATVDLVIIDLVMPTPGEEAVQTMREQGFDKPIVVLSGHLKPGDEERLLGLGVDAVLSKPFRLMGLLTNIEPYLTGK